MNSTIVNLALGGVAPSGLQEQDVIGMIGEARIRGLQIETSTGEITGDAASQVALGAVGGWFAADDARADFMRAIGVDLAPTVAQIEADADAYAHRALNDLRERPFMTPHTPNATYGAIPIDRTLAAPDALTYQWSFEDVEGAVEWSTDGMNVPAPVGTNRTFGERRPVWTYTATVSEQWLRRMLDSRAAPGAEGRRQAGAIALIRRTLSKHLAGGVAGADMWSLAAGMPALRTVSGTNYATGTDDAVALDIMRFLDRIGEEGEGAFATPNCVMFTQRAWNRANQRYSRATGVSNNLAASLREEIAGRGITVKINNELKNRGTGGTGWDLAVAFFDPGMGANGQPDGVDLEAAPLRHALAMDVAPVHRWTDGGGSKILFALRTGHLATPHAGSVVVHSMQVA